LLSGLIDGDELRLAVADPDAPVVVNAGGHGFWRVAYDTELRNRLSAETLTGLSTLERYNLVDDAWSATLSGAMSAAEFIDFVEGFGAERDHAVWQNIIAGLRAIGRLLDGQPHRDFQARIAALLGPVVADLGDPTATEDALVARLRGLLVGALAILGGDIDTQAHCRAVLKSPEAHHPDLVAAATSVVAATGDGQDYEWMLDRYRNGTTPQEQLRHLYALTEFDDAELIARTCSLAMSDEVKTQNAPFVLRMCIANRHHGESAWRFVRDHWAEAVERFPSNTIVRMVDSVKLLSTAEQVRTTQAFFAEHPIPQAAETLRQILERQEVNHRFREAVVSAGQNAI